VAAESFLLFAKSGEAVSWKTGLTNLEKLGPVVRLASETNASALASCPALVRMLEVPSVIAQRANATRARAKAVKAHAAATAAVATAATPPTAGSSGTGGAGH